MGIRGHASHGAAAPATAVEVLPEAPKSTLDTKHWWRHSNLRALNLWLLIPLLSIFSQG